MDTLIEWIKVLIEWVKCIPTTIICAFTAYVSWLQDFLLYIPRQVFAKFVAGIVAFFGIIPVPDFITETQGFLNQASAQMGYLFSISKLDLGITIVTTASIIRFIIRRIPGIG